MTITATHRNSSALLKRLYTGYIRAHKRRFLISIACMIIAAAATAANAYMMQPMLDDIFINRDRDKLVLIPILVILIAVIGSIATYGHTLIIRILGQRIVADMQTGMFSHLIHSDLGLFHDQASGRLISRFTNDIQQIRNAVSQTLTAFGKEALTMLFLIGVMLYQSVELTLIAFIAFPLAIFPVIRLGKRMRKIAGGTQMQLGEFTAHLDDVFQGARTVKAYAREDYESSRAAAVIEKLFALYVKAARVQAAASPMIEAMSGIVIAAVIWYGGFQVLNGETTPGTFFSFVTAFLMAYRPVKTMAGLNTVMQEGFAAADRLFDVLDRAPVITNSAAAVPLQVTRGHIRYQDVSFRYGPGTGGVERISLDVPPGAKVALVGLSGGGKTTLFNLLLRFYDVDSGAITVDGQNIRDVTLDSLRESIAYVTQDTVLFDDTVRTNIAYGKLNASEEDIIAAAKAAAADEFIRALPQGYDTPVGPHGVRLSGGQKQRISIARAMLKNAPILLLDEATSALDNESERLVQQALERLMQGRTTLIIAHRLTTVRHVDMLYIIEEGRVIESGTHDELLLRPSRYSMLHAQSLERAAPHATA